MNTEVQSQCAYCKLPEYPEGTLISHGMHDTCTLVFYGRKTYLKMIAKREARENDLQ